VGFANMVDDFQLEAMKSRLNIPILYAADAVHGEASFPQCALR
jgi:hypothetical protein